MKWFYILTLIVTLSFQIKAQKIIPVTLLSDIVRETSGLIYLDNRFITHNDSGGEPALYEIDTITGDVSRTVFVRNAENYDWEDICRDSTFIFIADIGNNYGSRKDLRIYRILISDYLDEENDSVTSEVIHFSYSDQTVFSYPRFTTNYDAEALIAYKDSLYVFTKNWGDKKTNIYALPKEPGTYRVERLDSIGTNGLVTGAQYDAVKNEIFLCGYSLESPFVITISGFNSNRFSSGEVKKYPVLPEKGYSLQIEGIAMDNRNRFYLTAEKSVTGYPVLYRLIFE